MMSRRAFLETVTAVSAVALRGAKAPGLKIGVMDTVFRMAGKPESVALAKRLGLMAVQVTLGRSADGKTLPLSLRQDQIKVRQADGSFVTVPITVASSIQGPIIAQRADGHVLV